MWTNIGRPAASNAPHSGRTLLRPENDCNVTEMPSESEQTGARGEHLWFWGSKAQQAWVGEESEVDGYMHAFLERMHVAGRPFQNVSVVV